MVLSLTRKIWESVNIFGERGGTNFNIKVESIYPSGRDETCDLHMKGMVSGNLVDRHKVVVYGPREAVLVDGLGIKANRKEGSKVILYFFDDVKRYKIFRTEIL